MLFVDLQGQAVGVAEKGELTAVDQILPDGLGFDAATIQPGRGGFRVLHPEGQVAQAHRFGVIHPLGGIGPDEELQGGLSQGKHPQIVILGGAVDLPDQLEAQLVYIKLPRLLPA